MKVVSEKFVRTLNTALSYKCNYMAVPSGPPQSLVITMKSHNLTFSWSPPLPSQRNGVIISYLIICSSGDIIINTTRTSSTSLTITGLQPFTNYTCSVSASTIIGAGPAVVKHILTSEDSKLHNGLYTAILLCFQLYIPHESKDHILHLKTLLCH